MLASLLVPFFTSFIIVILATPLVIILANRWHLVDDPRTHKHPAIIHKKTVPRAGGFPIYLGIIFGILLFIPLDPTIITIIIAAFLVVFMGLLDDRYDISPYFRFVGNILCAALVVFSGVHIPFITNPIGGILSFSNFSYTLLGIQFTASNILAILWISWIMNMLNWSKGVDGQMPGIAAVSAVVIGIASLRFPVLTEMNIYASQLSFIVAGASLGFLFYNFYPAKIFPGYSATILGFMIGILSIMSGVKLATAILVMGVPAADFMFTFTRRILAHKSPFRGDRGHLHHLLLDMGLEQRVIAFIYWFFSLLLGFFALNLSSRGKLFAIILVVVLVGAVILTLRYLAKKGELE